MKKIKLNFIFILTLYVVMFNGCKSKSINEDMIAFTMSDSMLKICKFYKVKNEEVKNEIRFFGKIEADNNKTAHVFSPVSGLVSSINVGLGDYVKEGEQLATIQSGEIANIQKEKLNALNDLSISEKNLSVAKDLFKSKLNSEKDVIAAEKELEKSKAEVERIKEVYNIYKIKQGSIFSVEAPISGFVISKKINSNEMVRPYEEEPLFYIANTNEIWAVAYVNESNISQIKVGYDVNVHTLAFPNTPYKGVIEKIYNVIDANTKSMKFRVRLINDDFKLKPDMNCTVSVNYTENIKLITIPASAVIFDKNKYWVMVFKDRHNIKTRQIEIYRQLGDKVYLKNGLNENEKIISENGLLIYDALND